jgi:hypothetical protein
MTRFVATATLVATITFAGPALAASAGARHVTAQSKGGAVEDVEGRIKTLHAQLHITPEQEPAWNNVAQVMRDNAKTMKDLRAKTQEKTQQESSANAVEQLNSYAAVIDAHSDGVHKFIPAFQTLYDSMSDAQKKTADAVLRTRVKEAARRQTR